MKANYINSTLKSFHKREFEDFVKFLSSEYFNRDSSLIQLAHTLNKHITLNSNANIRKQEIFQILHPNQVFNDLKLRHSISRFKKLLEEFLILNHNKTNKTLQNKTLLFELRKKNLKNNFRQTLNKIVVSYPRQTKVSIIDPNLEKYLILKEEYEFDHQFKRNTIDNIKPMVNSLEHFYLLENLRLACLDWINLKVSNNQEYFKVKIELMLNSMKYEIMSEQVNLNLFVQLYCLLYNHKDATTFSEIKIYLERIEDQISFEDKKTAYLLLLNYCIQKNNQGDIEYTKHALNQYKAGINNKVLLEKGVLSPYTYKNIVILLLTLEQYEETKVFIDSFKDYLPSDISQNSYQYNLALLHFKQNNFDQAMKLMANTNFIDQYDDLSARRMLIRIYYEKKEWNVLRSLLDSFEIYIKRRKNIGYHKESYFMLIHFTRKVLSLKSKDQMNAKKMLEELNNSPNFPEKNWLKFKIEETII